MLERLYKTVLEQAASSQITNRALEMQLEASHVKNRELSADLDKLRASIATSSGRDVRNPQVQSMAHQQVEIAALRNQLKEEKAAVVSAQNKLKIVESRCAALQKRLQAAEKAKEEALLSAKKAYPTPPTSSSRPLPIARSVTSNEMSDGSFDTRTLPTGHHPFSTHRILPPSVPKALTEPSAAGVLLHKETKEVVCFLSECRRPGKNRGSVTKQPSKLTGLLLDQVTIMRTVMSIMAYFRLLFIPDLTSLANIRISRWN